jgi:hypothetical protein
VKEAGRHKINKIEAIKQQSSLNRTLIDPLQGKHMTNSHPTREREKGRIDGEPGCESVKEEK